MIIATNMISSWIFCVVLIHIRVDLPIISTTTHEIPPPQVYELKRKNIKIIQNTVWRVSFQTSFHSHNNNYHKQSKNKNIEWIKWLIIKTSQNNLIKITNTISFQWNNYMVEEPLSQWMHTKQFKQPKQTNHQNNKYQFTKIKNSQRIIERTHDQYTSQNSNPLTHLKINCMV